MPDRLITTAWFAPNRYGYGIGMPTCRQGRLAITAYVALALGAGMVAAIGGNGSHGSLALVIGAVAFAVVATMIFLTVATMKTAGHTRRIHLDWDHANEGKLGLTPARASVRASVRRPQR